MKPRQRRALQALLTEKSIRAAALAAHVGESTLYRYLSDPDFCSELSRAESRLVDETARRLAAGGLAACDALELVIKDGNFSEKRQAAGTWLTHLVRLRELRMDEARLSELEGLVYSWFARKERHDPTPENHGDSRPGPAGKGPAPG